MYMVNQINLSDVNMRTLLLMILHDLPHDYKVKRLEDLWKHAASNHVATGQKGGTPEDVENEDDLKILDDIFNDDLKKEDLHAVVKILTEKYRNEQYTDKSNDLDDQKTKLEGLFDANRRITRANTRMIQILTELKNVMKIHVLDALHLSPPSMNEGGSTIMGGRKDIYNKQEQVIGYVSNPAIFKNPNQEKKLSIPGLQKELEESVTSSSNEHLNPSSKQKEESLPSTSRPQTNKTNPPTVTTNRTKNKKKSNKGTINQRTKNKKKSNKGTINQRTKNKKKSIILRRRRTRRTRRTTNRINKEKLNNEKLNNATLNNANDIRLKKNIAMNDIFINAFRIIFHGTTNNEIQDIITAFYHFYSMIKITSVISPLDVFDSSYVNSSLLIYLILKRSSIDVGLKDLKIIFETVFSSNNTFKGGANLNAEQIVNINDIRLRNDTYYIGATPLDAVPGAFMEDINNLFKIFKTTGSINGAWNDSLTNFYNIKHNTIDNQLKTIKIKETILSKPTNNSRREPYNAKLRDTINTLYLKIMFEHILIPIEKKIKQEQTEQNKNYDLNTPLQYIALANPHRLVSALMNGAFTYSEIQKETTESLDKNFYNYEFENLRPVSDGNGTYPSGDTLDDNLLKTFRIYADDKKTPPTNNNWNILDENPNYNGNNKPDIINNGVILTNSGIEGITSTDVTCTLSQRVDAMGNFGDCANTIYVGTSEMANKATKLSRTTDIIIMGEEQEGDYYASRMEEIIINNKRREILISYSFKLGNLQTPVFFKTIDNSSHRILDLSLTNTYKSVITRVLYIWANDNTLLPTVFNAKGLKKLYDVITDNKDTFIDLLLTSLQKGSGDNNQEFNAVFKDRGYMDLTTTPEQPVYKKPLLYVANDRPSAVRAMFTLINGTGDINDNVTAGFPSGRIYITRPPPINKKRKRQQETT